MKLVSKKNGTTTIFPNFISAIASKIGFTPPNGMTSTNVQSAIEEVNDNIYSSLLVEALNVNVTYNNSFRATGTVTLSKQGYRSLGALSSYVSNNTTYNGIAGVDFDTTNNQLNVAIFTLNHSSGSGNETVRVNVLWQKV